MSSICHALVTSPCLSIDVQLAVAGLVTDTQPSEFAPHPHEDGAARHAQAAEKGDHDERRELLNDGGLIFKERLLDQDRECVSVRCVRLVASEDL